jgi:alpha,alpha-trehalase
MTRVPPPVSLREYSLLADGERGVLIGPRGEMAWMCFPAWDSPSVFSSLLGGPGCYQIIPSDRHFVWGGYYDDSSLIWNDRWITTDAVIECRNALAFPGSPGTAVLLRRVVAVRGLAQVQVRLDVRADYARRTMTRVRRTGVGWEAVSGGVHLRWQPGPGARRLRTGELAQRVELEEGEHHDLVLELATDPLKEDPRATDELWQATEAGWRQAVPPVNETPARRDAAHAFAVLRGLTSGTGAMVATPTMALPERDDEGRNYDYRYAWIRDQCFVGQSAATVPGGEPLVDTAVRFVTGRLLEDGPAMKPAYRAGGGPVPREMELHHLPGYPGGRVKVGNWVNEQFQLDAFGESLLLLAAAARRDRVDHEQWKAAEVAVDAISDRWSEPDAGIWELDNRWWAHSRLTCVAGLRQIAACAGGAQAGEWTALADTITAETARTCLHPSGRWQRAPDDHRVDAALLMPAIRGAVAADDPRSLATLAAVETDLCEDGYIYRFRHDDRPLGEAEGAFSLCGFVVALAFLQQGRRDEAVAWFERNRASCGPPGLLTEEFDVRERQLRGNLPQAFVHSMLLETSMRIGCAGPGA